MADMSYMGGNTSTSYMGPGAPYSPASLGTSPLYAVAPDDRGEISKGWSRGVDNLQAMGYGAVGAVSDALGNKDFAGKMYEGAQANLAEAANSPASVAQFTDIGGPGEAWDWFKGAAAEALPSSLAAFVAAGAVSATGGLAAPAVAVSGIGGTIFKSAVNKLATDATTKAVIASAIEQQVAKGIAVEAAKKAAVKEFFKAELAANAKMIGAYAGGATAASAMETGSNWNEDVAKYGLANTSPLSDIGYGIAGGIVEAGLGAETRLAASMLRQQATKELEAAAKRGLVRSIGRGVLAGSGSEAAEEGIQTALSAMSLARDPFTAQDPKEIFNSAMGGAAGGVLFGAASGTHSGLKGKAYKEMQAKLNPTTPEIDSDGNPLQQADRTSNFTGVRQSIIQKQTTDQIATYEQRAKQINDARSQLTSAIIAVHNDPNMDQKTKEETIKQHENATMELSAQLSQLAKERSSFEEGSRKELEKLNKKMADLAIEKQAHEYNTVLYDTYTPEQKGKAAMLLTNIRGEADNELTKANLRIRQHQAALNALNKHYNQIMSEGGVVPSSYNAAVKFHENNIKDEQKFSAGITKQFEQDLHDVDDAVKNNARYTYPGRPVRDANAARNTIASFYESTAKSLQDTVVGKKDLRDKVVAKREHDISKSAFSKAYLAAVSESAKHNLNEYKKYEQDFNNLLIQDEIATGQLPGVQGPLPPYTDLTEAPGAIPGAISDSAEFTNAMVNPRVSDPAPSRNVDPAQYQNQVQRQRDAFKKQQVLGALAAWKAADNAKTATTEAATKQAQNLATMWNHMDIAQSSPIAAQSKQRVLGWITHTLDKLDALRDVVKLVHTSEISLLPDYVSKKYEAGDKGLIDLRTGTIYLFSDNINSKEDAVRTVLHEGVAHYGLRSLLSPEVLDKFLRLVHREFSSDARYKKIAEKYSEAKSFEIAEEFIADLAERIHLSKVDMSIARRALTNIKKFIMRLLSNLGLVSVTRQDVDNTLLASVYYLAKRDAGLLQDSFKKHAGNNNLEVLSKKDVDKVDTFKQVRGTPEYEKRFGFLRNWRKWLDRTTLAITPSGKIVGAEEVTPREKLATGLHDTFDRWGQLVHKVKEAGGKVTNETNVSQIEKTTHNRIATNVGAFLKGVVGIDPGNWFARPEEGTLFFDMTKLIGTNKNIPSDPKQLLHTVGKVLQAMHAEEANLELVRKQHGTMVMGELNKKIDAAEAKKAAGTKTTEQMVKLEKELAKLYDMKEAVEKDIRRDLSGMSNEEAAEILGTYVTKSNEMLWNTISDRVQEINKKFLDTAVANNLLSPEMRAYWDKLYKNYVPLDVWEAHMSKVDPAFASMGRSFDMSMFELSKERTGKTGGLETNPLVLLTRKYTQLIQAIEQNRVTVSVYNLVKDNPEAMSEIVIIDDSLQAREFSTQYKELLKEADKVLGTRNITSMKQAMKDLRKRIAELRMDRSKAKLELRRRTSEDAKAKQADKITKIEMDIQSALDAIETMKADILDMRSRDDYKAVTTKMKELNKKRQALYNSRGYKVESRNGILTKVRKSSKFEGQAGNTVTAILPDGTKVRMLIKDVHLLAAIKGTSTMNPGLIVQSLGKIQRVMAQLMTTYAPPFIVVNWVRDLSTGLIHMGNIAEDIKDLHWSSSEARSAFFSNVKRSVKAAYEFERNRGKISDPTMAQYMDLFRKNGGYTEMYGLTSYEATKKDMERALTTATNKGKAKDFMFAAANYMQDASSAVENSTRLAAFTAIYEALLKNNVDPAKAAQRAASAALDLTVNFTKRGTWSPVLSSLFLFSQASINSTVRIAKAMFPASDHGKPFYQRRVFKYGHRLAIIGFIAAMAAKALGGTDDDGVDFYDKLPAYVRSTNLVIAVGRNKFIRIPVTFGYQVMVNLGVVAADMLTGRATLGKATSTMWDSTIQNFSFVGGGDEGVTALTPTIFKPLVQVYANKNFFGGNVYPEAGNWSKGEKPDSQKYWANTSELAKKTAYWINLIGGGSIDRPAKLSMLDISPATMEHIFKQYLGGVGQFMLGTLEASEKLATGRTEKLTVDSLPILSRFGSHVDNAATMSEYTRVKTELETQVNEYKRAKATGTVQEVMQSTMAGRMLEKKLNKVQDKLSDMKADLNKVELAKGSSAEEVYRKRIANEEKAAMLVKDLIRQARAAGVK